VCFCDTWEVLKVEVYARVRRAVRVDGMSVRRAAREFGLSRKTIRKMLAFSVPPGSQRKKPVRRPKLGPWLGVVDQILEDDESRPKKQRHTARRIYDRLKEEHAFTGGYTVVKDYVRDARLRHKEVFLPLAHPPGDAQADFGEALVVIGGVEQKGHFLCVDLPHSDDSFVMMFPAENTEAFCEGHNQAFAYVGGVPRTMLYDNTSIAVKEITGDGERKPTEEFSRLKSHYLFEVKFGRPGASTPSLRSPARIRGAPQVGFSRAMRLTVSKTLESSRGRPKRETRLRQRQYRRNPARCQRTTVSGCTTISASVQRSQRQRSATQNRRSRRLMRGRGRRRLSTASCWRRARISKPRSWRERRKPRR
jgi:transposase